MLSGKIYSLVIDAFQQLLKQLKFHHDLNQTAPYRNKNPPYVFFISLINFKNLPEGLLTQR